jgi:hypothetical protein
MRDPLPQPLTLDGALVTVRNASRLLDALGLRGVIVMWSGALSSLPTGWVLCDGRSGTPDLRDRFAVGARTDVGGVPHCTLTGSPTKSGGNITHTHTFKTGGHLHGTKSGGPFDSSVGGLDLVSATDSGVTDVANTVPVPYYALAFIMKV